MSKKELRMKIAFTFLFGSVLQLSTRKSREKLELSQKNSKVLKMKIKKRIDVPTSILRDSHQQNVSTRLKVIYCFLGII